jgi:hypothetical protein
LVKRYITLNSWLDGKVDGLAEDPITESVRENSCELECCPPGCMACLNLAVVAQKRDAHLGLRSCKRKICPSLGNDVVQQDTGRER